MLMRCKMGKTCFGGKGNGLGCSMFGMLNVWDAWDAQYLMAWDAQYANA